MENDREKMENEFEMNGTTMKYCGAKMNKLETRTDGIPFVPQQRAVIRRPSYSGKSGEFCEREMASTAS